MKFGRIAIHDAHGALLAHSVSGSFGIYRKGRVITAADVETLHAAGVAHVIAARLEQGDVGEDDAATELTHRLQGTHTNASVAFTGRVNLYAACAGFVTFDADAITALNATSEAISVATLPCFEEVAPRTMLATVKIIPFAVPRVDLDRAITTLHDTRLGVARFLVHQLGLITTSLPHSKSSLHDKNIASLNPRLRASVSTIGAASQCAHDEEALAAELSAMAARRLDPILVYGASAITDRRDVVPAAVIRAGGKIDRFGMPVDPGNLLMIGTIGSSRVIGLPGCARSPKLNGFDFVLQRMLAQLPVGGDELARMGVGGLLKEIATRPQPREASPQSHAATTERPRVTAIVLAAGFSRRMGANKLTAELAGVPVLKRTLDSIRASQVDRILVVTGEDDDAAQQIAAGDRTQFVYNPQAALGLSSSLAVGVRAAGQDADAVIICLGDMPFVQALTINRLIAAFAPDDGRLIIVPTAGGKRGNPVLWGATLFPALVGLSGDSGARHLIADNADVVCDVETGDKGIFIDIDTPEAMRQAVAAMLEKP